MVNTYYAYIITNDGNVVLYTGITNDLQRRIYEHRQGIVRGFTSKYNVNKLVWFEKFPSPQEAIAAEKKIKGWTRKKKLKLIEEENPTWKDLMG